MNKNVAQILKYTTIRVSFLTNKDSFWRPIMFLASLELKNFRSFEHFSIDFLEKANTPKQLAFIYGENGSGKTTIVDALSFLQMSIKTITDYYAIMSLFNSTNPLTLFAQQNNNKEINELKQLIAKVRPVEAEPEEMTSLDFAFFLNDKKYVYSLTLSASEVIEESLSYPVAKNFAKAFSISRKNGVFSFEKHSALFLDSEEKEKISVALPKSFGKNTFLSFVLNELKNSPNREMDKAFDPGLVAFLDGIQKIRILTKAEEQDPSDPNFFQVSFDHDETRINSNPLFLANPLAGSDVDDKVFQEQKKNTAHSLSVFFRAISSSFRGVCYRNTLLGQNKTPIYLLYFQKNSHGKMVEVPYYRESTGHLQLVRIFFSLVSASAGDLVVADEVDEGIHDLLFVALIKELVSEGSAFKGQLIATTHNFLAMNNNLPKSSIYILDIPEGGKDPLAKSVDQYSDVRIQAHNNIEKQYSQGVFGGVPYPGIFSFSETINDLKGGK